MKGPVEAGGLVGAGLDGARAQTSLGLSAEAVTELRGVHSGQPGLEVAG